MAAKADGKDDADFSDSVYKRRKSNDDRFNRKLDALFKILIKSPHSLRDDTFLEKLQDGIAKQCKNDGKLAYYRSQTCSNLEVPRLEDNL